MAVAALGPAQEAAAVAGHRIERLDDPEQGQPVGVHGEAEAAALAACRCQHPRAGEPVEGLREVVAGDAYALGDVVDAGGLAVPVGEEEDGAERVLGGLGEQGNLGMTEECLKVV